MPYESAEHPNPSAEHPNPSAEHPNPSAVMHRSTRTHAAPLSETTTPPPPPPPLLTRRCTMFNGVTVQHTCTCTLQAAISHVLKLTELTNRTIPVIG